MNIATIAMLIAVIVLFGGACFVKNKPLNFLLQAFGFVALLGLGAVVGNSQNNFSGFVVFLLVSIAPQFLNLFDMQSYIKSKQEKVEQKENNAAEITAEIDSEKEDSESTEQQQNQENSTAETLENTENEIIETTNENEEQPQESQKKSHFLLSKGDFLSGIASLLSAICVTFAGLYLGLETFYGAIFGVAAGLALMFLYLALKKEINKFDLFGVTFSFIAAGLLLGCLLTVILYSITLTNILFCVGCLIIATSFTLQALKKTRFDGLIYCVGMICLFSTLLF